MHCSYKLGINYKTTASPAQNINSWSYRVTCYCFVIVENISMTLQQFSERSTMCRFKDTDQVFCFSKNMWLQSQKHGKTKQAEQPYHNNANNNAYELLQLNDNYNAVRAEIRWHSMPGTILIAC